MPSIEYAFDKQSFNRSSNSVNLSDDDNNALSFNENGQIKMTLQLPTGNANNTPGDGFDGKLGEPIPIIRLNSSVSRKVATDPDPANEGMCIPTFLDEYWEYLQQQANQ